MPDVKIFLCSASEDEDSRKKLEEQLAPYRHSCFIQDIWYSQKIEGGMEKNLETQKHLHASQIILLLVSPSFMNTNECYDLMLQAMERHTKGEARVVPVLLRPVEWAEAPFSKLQALPKNEKPITSWSKREEAFREVAEGIFDIIKKKDDPPKEEREAKETELPTYLPVVRTQNTALTTKTLEAPSFTHVRTLIDHRGPVASVAYSQDGQLLVSDSWDGTIKIRDRDAGQELYSFTGHVGAIYSVVFSADGSRLVSGGDDRTVKIWDTHQGRLLQTLTGHSGPISSVACSLEERIVISGSDDATIIIWDVQAGLPRHKLIGHAGPVSSLALSADKKTLASGSWDGTVKLWEIHSGKPLKSFEMGFHGPIYSIASSPDMGLFISGNQDGTITVLDMRETITTYILSGHSGPVSSVALSPDMQTLASGSYDKTVKVWSLVPENISWELKGHTEAVLSVAFHPDGYTIVSGSLDKSIRIWEKPQVSRKPRITVPLPHMQEERKNSRLSVQ